MRRAIFWSGWILFSLLPIAFVTEVLVRQDMPPLPPWKLLLPLIALFLVILGRNPDDVLNHHLR